MSFDARARALEVLDALVDQGAVELDPRANRAALAADLAELLAVPLDASATLDWLEGWLFAQDEVAEVYASRPQLARLIGAVGPLDN